jgi:3-deoxy-D-manno-octulosonate 8-phosphate phosphatase (KDO 8-P phosphatase)
MIKLLATDVDGTLTDGKIYLGENGEVMKTFNVKDGYAIHDVLQEHGIIPIIITNRKSKIVENRARELGVELVFQGIKDKFALLKNLASKNGITLEDIAYIGDDISDLECIKACGVGGCPSDAVDVVKSEVDYICKSKGGEGAVREFVGWVLKNNY